MSEGFSPDSTHSCIHSSYIFFSENHRCFKLIFNFNLHSLISFPSHSNLPVLINLASIWSNNNDLDLFGENPAMIPGLLCMLKGKRLLSFPMFYAQTSRGYVLKQIWTCKKCHGHSSQCVVVWLVTITADHSWPPHLIPRYSKSGWGPQDGQNCQRKIHNPKDKSQGSFWNDN